MTEKIMDISELASKMLDWEKKRRELDALTKEIQDAVFVIKETQTTGHVRATYSKGRKDYKYEFAVAKAGITTEQLKPFTKPIPATSVINFSAACKEFKIEDIPFDQADPSVTVKLLNNKKGEQNARGKN